MKNTSIHNANSAHEIEEVIITGSALTDAYGGGLSVPKQLMAEGFYNYSFIGKFDTLGKIVQSMGYEYTNTRSALEPVTPLNILLSPISFLWGLFHFIKFQKRFKSAKAIIEIGFLSDIVFVFPYIITLFKKKPIIILQLCVTKAVSANPFRFIIQWVFDRSMIIFVSNFQKNTFLEAGFSFKESTVIFHGLSELSLPFSKLHQDSKPNSVIRFGYIGRIHKEKGVLEMIEAVDLLGECSKNFSLLIGGEGPEMDQLKARASDLELPVFWYGWVNDKKDFFDNIDVLIVPSTQESFGLVVIEAWQNGVPTITSNIGSFRELKLLSTHNDMDLVFEVGNSDSLKNIMLKVIDNPKTYISSEESINLNNIVNSTFSVQKTLSEYHKIINQL